MIEEEEETTTKPKTTTQKIEYQHLDLEAMMDIEVEMTIEITKDDNTIIHH